MEELIKRLRGGYNHGEDFVEWANDITDEAADAIEQLQAELNEQARLNGMGAEREAALMAKVEQLRAELATMRQQIAEVKPVATKLETQQFNCFHVSFEDSKRLKELPIGTKLYTTPQPCPKCAKAVEALRKAIEQYKANNGHFVDWTSAHKALAELEK